MVTSPTASKKAVVQISNVEPTMRLMAKYGREFNKMVRATVKRDVSPYVAGLITTAAKGSSPQGRAVAGTFRATGDRLPAVRGFGSRRVTSSKVPAGVIGFGANWGGGKRVKTYMPNQRVKGRGRAFQRHTTRQFGPWLGGGNNDRFIYSVIGKHTPEINERWQLALDECYLAWKRAA